MLSLSRYPWALRNYAELKVSLQRLDKFLKAAEMQEGATKSKPTTASAGVSSADVKLSSKGSVVVRDAVMYWAPPKQDQDEDKAAANGAAANGAAANGAANGAGAGAGAGARAGSGGDDDSDESKEDEVLPVLSNVSFEASPGDLVAVVGPVGSGKSSLAAGMLGELFIAKGEVSVSGSIAYVAQTSWIQHLSLQGRLARARLAPSSPVITSGAVLLHRQHPVRQTHGPQSLQGRAPHVPA